jgi:ketosteroid isomerase-like protein
MVSAMSGEHPHALAYRRTADAFRAADSDALTALIAIDVIWHLPGTNGMPRELWGRDEVLSWLSQLRARAFQLVEHDVFGNDEHVCALSVMGAERDGVAVEARVVSLFHYRDGQQLERWFYPEDRAAWDQIVGE